MTQLTKSFILTALSAISTQSIFAYYPYENDEASYRQNQMRDNQENHQYSPDTNAERSFMLESDSRLDQIQQENRNMIEQDRRMMREGYDPNENYYNNSNTRRTKEQYDPNNPDKNQEQMLRGELRGYHQASDRSANYPR